MTQSRNTRAALDAATAAEVGDLRERVEEQFREREVIEQRFRDLAAQLDLESKVVQIKDTLPSLVDRPSVPAPSGVAEPDEAEQYELGKDSEPWWPTEDAAADPVVPSPGWSCYTLRHKTTKILGISVCELERPALARIVEMIVKQQRASRDFIPVFLPDSPHFDLFRSKNFVFEYLPPEPKRDPSRSKEGWSAYADARLRLLMRKWNIAQVIQFGPTPFGA